MRIEAYNQVNQVYQSNKVMKTEKSAKASATDAVQISSIGLDYQMAQKAVSEADDVREDLVNSFKQKLQSGNYKVSAEAFADKLMQKMNEVR